MTHPQTKETPMTITYAAVAEATGTTIPTHLEAQAEVPVVVKAGRQGDVYLRREAHPAQNPTGGVTVTGTGHKVVQGDADRNSHILNTTSEGVRFYPGEFRTRFDYGLLVVPDGAVCFLTHTSEHGSIGVGAGQWRVWGQVSFEDEIRRAAD